MNFKKEIYRKAGNFFIIGLPNPNLDYADRKFIESYNPGGVVLFERNVASPLQLLQLTTELKSLIPDIIICIDHEGGRVNRLPAPFTKFPPLAALGKDGRENSAWETGEAQALELAAVGINFNLAPVLDLALHPENKVIGDRSLGSDPQKVAALGAAIIRGLQAGGVLACAKHFPGHGAAAADSHLVLPELDDDLKVLEKRDWIPFAAGIAAGVDAVMTAHIRFNSLDPAAPASLSANAMRILRGRLGHRGLILTDDLEMKAISDNYAVDRAAVKAIAAGADMALICHKRDVMLAAKEALIGSITSGEIPELRIRESLEVINAFKQKARTAPESQSGADELKIIGCEKHLALAAKISSRGA